MICRTHGRRSIELHRLGDVIVIAICAVIANADGPTAIAKWAKLNAVWLRRHLALPNGIPGKDTFRRVLGLLHPTTFQQCFQQWLESLNLSADDDSGNPANTSPSTARRCGDRTTSGTVWEPCTLLAPGHRDHGITLGQVATEEKSNEITAIPQLLKMIDLEDAIVRRSTPQAVRRRLLRRSSKARATTSWH